MGYEAPRALPSLKNGTLKFAWSILAGVHEVSGGRVEKALSPRHPADGPIGDAKSIRK